MDSLHKKEASLDRDLHSGNAIKAAITLQDELQKNPQEALQLVKSELCRAGYANDKNHVGIMQNGDLMIYNKDNSVGYYAGTLPDGLRQQALNMNEPGRAESAPPQLVPHNQEAVAQPAQVATPGYQGQPYEYQQQRQPGYHVPFPIDIGVEDGSLHVGLNVLGLAKGGIMLGEHNRGYVGSDVAQTEISAGVDLNSSHIGPAADWRVLDGQLTEGKARVGITPGRSGINVGAGFETDALGHTIGTGGSAGAEIGQRVGPHVNGYVFAGPANVSADGFANLSDRGLRTGADADVSAQPAIGVHAKARAGLGQRNEAHVDAGANIGDNGVAAGAGLYPQLHPDLYARANSGDDAAGVGLNPARAWNRRVPPRPPSNLEMGGLY